MNVAPRTSTRTRVRSVSTGLLCTEVHQVLGSYVWVHRLGSQASTPFSSLPLTTGTTLNTNLVTLGKGEDDYRRYATSARYMIFDLLAAAESADLRPAGQRWGMALRSLHQNASFAGTIVRHAPRTIRRAEAWIDGDWHVARDVLSDRGLARIRRWVTSMMSSPHTTLVHGHPGMAHWVVGSDGKAGTLLTGEDAGIADPQYDVAWVLGEIAELYAFYPAWRTALTQLRAGFLQQCRAVPRPAQLSPGVAFRLAHHAYDWRHYAGATEEQAQKLLRLAARYLLPRGQKTS